MSRTQHITDKFAIGLSLLCVLHCVALPVSLLLLPSIAALNIDNESFHFGMMLAILPTSIYALSRGYQQHRQHLVPAFIIAGLLLLMVAIVFHEAVGEQGEIFLTLSGSVLIATGHYGNFNLCQKGPSTKNSSQCKTSKNCRD